MRKRSCRRAKKKFHQPPPPKLSEVLQGMLQPKEGECSLSVNYLLAKTQGQGIFLTVILLALPFMVPLLPGMSTPFGVAIIYLAWKEVWGEKKGLPAWMGDRPIEARKFSKIIQGTMKLLRFIESGVKPRFSWWMLIPGMGVFHWVLIAFLAFLLALPLPLPASNTLPAIALVVVTATVMERDGIMIWFGYLLSLVSLGWIAAFALAGEQVCVYLLEWLKGLY